MSQPQKSLGVFKLGAILLGLFASLYLLVSKVFGKSRAVKGVEHHKSATHPDAALKYWTADKMRHAKPAELPQVDASDRGKPHAPRQA